MRYPIVLLGVYMYCVDQAETRSNPNVWHINEYGYIQIQCTFYMLYINFSSNEVLCQSFMTIYQPLPPPPPLQEKKNKRS